MPRACCAWSIRSCWPPRWPGCSTCGASPPRSSTRSGTRPAGIEAFRPALASLGEPGRARRAGRRQAPRGQRPCRRARHARRSRCCSRSARSGRNWCAPVCARGSAWSPRPATPSTSITSPASSAMAPRRCTRGSRWPRSSRCSVRPKRRRSRPTRRVPRRPKRGALSHGRREGAAQDPVEDGHLDALIVLRRADLRGAGPRPRGHRRGLLAARPRRSAASASTSSPRTCWRVTRRRMRRRSTDRDCPTSAACASARKARITAGRRRWSWRCSRR